MTAELKPPVDVPKAVPIATTSKTRIAWIDALKGMAILAVLAHHYAEPGVQFAARLSDRGITASLGELWRIAASSTGNPVDALAMFLSGLGYQGVPVFLVVSGFGLALADSRCAYPMMYRDFLVRRAARLLPPYWLLVALLGMLGLLLSQAHWHPSWLIGSSRSDVLVNALLIRNFTERWVWIYPGALWFVPLIVQLYLLYPVLARAMRRAPNATLVVCALITVTYRAVAVFAWHGVPVGINALGKSTPLLFCFARLFEFAFGIWLAQRGRSWWASATSGQIALAMLSGATIWLGGIVFACFRAGFVLSDPVIGVGLTIFLWGLVQFLQKLAPFRATLAFMGQRSYALFLMHTLLIPTPLSFVRGRPYLIGLVIYCGAACLLAIGLDAVLDGLRIAWQARQLPRTVTETA